LLELFTRDVRKSKIVIGKSSGGRRRSQREEGVAVCFIFSSDRSTSWRSLSAWDRVRAWLPLPPVAAVHGMRTALGATAACRPRLECLPTAPTACRMAAAGCRRRRAQPRARRLGACPCGCAAQSSWAGPTWPADPDHPDWACNQLDGLYVMQN
jgi:hypothetical protein